MNEIDGQLIGDALQRMVYEMPSLRDRFAMAALASFDTSEFNSWEAQADAAYKCVDAMLKAREIKQGSPSTPPVADVPSAASAGAAL